MQKPSLFVGLLLAAVTTSGCAPYLAPYGGRYHGYPGMRPAPMVTVDPDTMARGRWDSVMRVSPGSTLDVLTMDGALVGKIAGADGYTLRVLVNGVEEQIPRGDVLRIDLVDLPGSEVAAVAKRAAGGALLGVGGMTLLGGVIGGEAWPPPAILLRAGAAAGGLAGGQAALISRRSRVIYLAEDQRPPLRHSARRNATKPQSAGESYSADEWSAIARLRPNIPVAVLTTSGVRYEGKLIAADTAAIRIDLAGAELSIPRASVVRVDVLESPDALALPTSKTSSARPRSIRPGRPCVLH